MFVRLLSKPAHWTGLLALSLLLLAGCTEAPPTVRQESARSFAAVDAYVGQALAHNGAPGAALAVVTPDGIEHQQTWGQDGDDRPVTARTPFLWGSVAKPVCAELVLIMVERGLLELDSPVRHYLPAFRLADADHTAQVTLRQLLNHTSGLPGDMLGLTDIVDPDRRPADILPALAEIEPEHEPGSTFQYTSVDYAVLAAVIEEVTGRSYAAVAESLLLDPIGARSAITTTADATDRLPRGHRYVYGNAVPFRTGYDPAGVSYGYLGGTLDDLARFAQLNLAEGTMAGREIISPAALTSAWAPDVAMSGDGESYGLGWRSQPLPDGTPIIWHSGAAPGFFAHIILLPEQDRAVILLQNSHGEIQALDEYQAGFGAATLLAGSEPAPITTDNTYPVVIGIASLIVLMIITGIVASAIKLRRHAPGLPRWWRVRAFGWLASAGALWAAALAMPELIGVPLKQLWLWNPDVTALAYGILGAMTLLVALRLVRVMRVD